MEYNKITPKIKKLKKMNLFKDSGLDDLYFFEMFNKIYDKINELKWVESPFIAYEAAFKEKPEEHSFSIIGEGLPNSRDDYIKYFTQFLQFTFNIKIILDSLFCNSHFIEAIYISEVVSEKSEEAVIKYLNEEGKNIPEDKKEILINNTKSECYKKMSHNMMASLNDTLLINIFNYVQMFDTFEDDLNYFIYRTTEPEKKVNYVHDPLTDFFRTTFKEVIKSSANLREKYDKYCSITKTNVKWIKMKSLIHVRIIYTISYIKNFFRDLIGVPMQDTFEEYKNAIFKKNYDNRLPFITMFYDEIKNMNNAKRIIQDPEIAKDMNIMHLYNGFIKDGIYVSKNTAETDNILKPERMNQYETMFKNATSLLIYTHNTIKELFLEYNVRTRRFG